MPEFRTLYQLPPLDVEELTVIMGALAVAVSGCDLAAFLMFTAHAQANPKAVESVSGMLSTLAEDL
jgi:hypothetical protein